MAPHRGFLLQNKEYCITLKSDNYIDHRHIGGGLKYPAMLLKPQRFARGR